MIMKSAAWPSFAVYLSLGFVMLTVGTAGGCASTLSRLNSLISVDSPPATEHSRLSTPNALVEDLIGSGTDHMTYRSVDEIESVLGNPRPGHGNFPVEMKTGVTESMDWEAKESGDVQNRRYMLREADDLVVFYVPTPLYDPASGSLRGTAGQRISGDSIEIGTFVLSVPEMTRVARECEAAGAPSLFAITAKLVPMSPEQRFEGLLADGECYMRMGRGLEAAISFEMASRLRPESEQASWRTAVAYCAARYKHHAQAALERFLATSSERQRQEASDAIAQLNSEIAALPETP